MELNEQTINANDLGFTEEDIKDAGIDLEKSDETLKDKQVEPEVTKQEDTELKESTDNNDDKVNESVQEDVKSEEDHSDNLSKALAEERSKRKALKKQTEEYLAEIKRLQSLNEPQITPETREEVTRIAKERAKAKLRLTSDETELMFVDPNKYAEYVREVARNEVHMMDEVEERQRVFNSNVAFVRDFKSAPNFNEIWAKGLEILNTMTLGEARPIENAFVAVDNGVGTEDDFNTIRAFQARIQKELAPVVKETNPIAKVKDLPKASSLNTGKTSNNVKISNEEILKLVGEGRENELPKDIQDTIKDLFD